MQNIDGTKLTHNWHIQKLTDLQNEFFIKRIKKINLINKRSKLNYFGFHVSNPLLKILRNKFLKYLVKNSKFIESYLGTIYRKKF